MSKRPRANSDPAKSPRSSCGSHTIQTPKAIHAQAVTTDVDALDTAAPASQPKADAKKRRFSQSVIDKGPKASKKQKEVKSAAVMPVPSSPNSQTEPADLQVVKAIKVTAPTPAPARSLVSSAIGRLSPSWPRGLEYQDEPILGRLSPAFRGEAARQLVQGAHWRDEIRHHFVVPYSMNPFSLSILQDAKGWLNDTIVMCYFHLLLKALEPKARTFFAFLNTTLVATVRSKSGMLPGHHQYYSPQLKELQQAKIIFALIHYADHWALAAFDVVEHHYILSDSAAPNGTFAEAQQLVHPILEFLTRQGVVATFEEKGSWEYLGNPFRTQDNRNDCGLFVLASTKYLVETSSLRYRLPITQSVITPFRRHVLFELAIGKVASFCPGPNFFMTVEGHQRMRKRVGFRQLAKQSEGLASEVLTENPPSATQELQAFRALAPEGAVTEGQCAAGAPINDKVPAEPVGHEKNAPNEVPSLDTNDEQGSQPLVADPVSTTGVASDEVRPAATQGFQESRALAPEGATIKGSSIADVPQNDKVTAKTAAHEQDAFNEISAVAPQSPQSRQPLVAEDVDAATTKVGGETSSNDTIAESAASKKNAYHEVSPPAVPQELQELRALAPDAATTDTGASAIAASATNQVVSTVGPASSTPRTGDEDPDLPVSIRLVRTAFNRANRYLSQLEARASPRASKSAPPKRTAATMSPSLPRCASGSWTPINGPASFHLHATNRPWPFLERLQAVDEQGEDENWVADLEREAEKEDQEDDDNDADELPLPPVYLN
ncbi:hypothetical protein KEM56_002752 [Ascosphaera pollenicola]|nr:hypothetical protein KEM56_002752 [Ascosphaera pollenicola]